MQQTGVVYLMSLAVIGLNLRAVRRHFVLRNPKLKASDSQINIRSVTCKQRLIENQINEGKKEIFCNCLFCRISHIQWGCSHSDVQLIIIIKI